MTNWQVFWICLFAYLIVVVVLDFFDKDDFDD